MTYKETSFWKKFVESAPDLARSFESSRKYAALIAGEIHRENPSYTVHDISHSDSLWEQAEVICGIEYTLTPAETYVLGIAFLIHDLAMGADALPDPNLMGPGDLRWRDMLAAEFHSTFTYYPSVAELEKAPAEVASRAKASYLRERHAELAQRIPNIEYRDSEKDTPYYLIQDPDLRNTYGHLAGRIAESHWWPAKRLRHEFDVIIGASAGMPETWKVDPLVIACILRVSDASHLDAGRAPGFLRALRRPRSTSRDHWVFQEKLHRPRRVEETLIFTSASPFTKDEASAWWLCWETLQMVHEELSSVDSILSDRKRARFAARMVGSVNDVDALANLIPPIGWYPIDARIKVGDVIGLVKRLGGSELYGDDAKVPLRELISNASDAVRAKKAMLTANGVPEWEATGDITVSFIENADGIWLSVSDTGIGMSKNVMSDSLLNFGTSYWSSPQARQDLPGLLSSGFQPTGEYGIGFFSVFMIGTKVSVISRRYDRAIDETLVLEFNDGLEMRPILRAAENHERRFSGGTEVRVLLHSGMKDRIIKWGSSSEHRPRPDLKAFIAWLCPAMDVDVYVADENKRSKVVSGGDWLEIPTTELVDRIYANMPPEKRRSMEEQLPTDLRPVQYRGATIARCALSFSTNPDSSNPNDEFEVVEIEECDSEQDSDEDFGFSNDRFSSSFSAPVLVGGVRSESTVDNIAGLILGRPRKAARDVAFPIAPPLAFSEWATEQASRINCDLTGYSARQIPMLVCWLHGDTGSFILAEAETGNLNFDEIVDFCRNREEISIVQDAHWSICQRSHPGAQLSGDVLAVPLGLSSYLNVNRRPPHPDLDWRSIEDGNLFHGHHSLVGRVGAAIGESWGVDPSRIWADMANHSEYKWPRRRLARVGSKPLQLSPAHVISRSDYI